MIIIPNQHIGTITPADAIMLAIQSMQVGSIGDNFRYAARRGDYDSLYGKPGAVIEHMKAMNPKWAKALKNLKAEHLDKLWFDLYFIDQKWEAKKQHSCMLIEFDKGIVQ